LIGFEINDNNVIEEFSKTLAEYTTGTSISKLLNRLGNFNNDSQENSVKLSTKWKRLDNSICNLARLKKVISLMHG
jgi:hypothetical protein